MVKDDRIWFGKSGNNVPSIKRFLSEVKDGITPMTIWTYDQVGHNQEATKEVRELGVLGCDSPKPTRLLERIVQISTDGDSIILDFFAGSGTTGHAVMNMNASDGGKRHYIVVQLPELLDAGKNNQKVAVEFCEARGKPKLLSELTKERLRRAAQKIKKENPLFTGDLGFRVFKLDTSNIRTWEASDRDGLEETLIENVDHLKPDRSERDVLYEVLLKLGIDLCAPAEARTVAGKSVHSVGVGALFVCLAERIARTDIEPLAFGIAEWHAESAPDVEATVVFRDSAFTDDVAKANCAAILAQRGLGNVRTL